MTPESRPESRPQSRPQSRPGLASRRRAARIVAVQALYQIALSGVQPERAIDDVLRIDAPESEREETPIDSDLLHDIVVGVTAETIPLDETIATAIARGRRLEEIEVLLRLILRSGCWELMQRRETDPPVIIKEYVAVASAFFSGPEPGFINGVLDRLARDVRGPKPDGDGPGNKNGSDDETRPGKDGNG